MARVLLTPATPRARRLAGRARLQEMSNRELSNDFYDEEEYQDSENSDDRGGMLGNGHEKGQFILEVSDIHQAALSLCFDESETGMKWRGWMSAASVALVVFQLVLLAQINICAETRRCVETNEANDCLTGQFCSDFATCKFCGTEYENLGSKYSPGPDFKCPLEDRLCIACYQPKDQAFLAMTKYEYLMANLESMHRADWIVLIFLSAVVGFTYANEAQGINRSKVNF